MSNNEFPSEPLLMTRSKVPLGSAAANVIVISLKSKAPVQFAETALTTVPAAGDKLNSLPEPVAPVSYTHLDVYKRQSFAGAFFCACKNASHHYTISSGC